MIDNRVSAIVLAAGKGKRMESKVAKQYLTINEKPILYYSLMEFERNEKIDEIILVVGENDIEFCKNDIVEKYNFKKIRTIIKGGKERYNSVYNALNNIDKTKYVLIHDGARPFITQKTINDVVCAVIEHKACIVGVSSKDTIKIGDIERWVESTPSRDVLWSIQTPQAFEYNIILAAYKELIKEENINVTDDSMVLELMTKHPIKIVEGDYRNIKITTVEDLIIGEQFLKMRNLIINS